MHARTTAYRYPNYIFNPRDFPSVSVLIGNYNHSEMVKIVVNGLLNQVLAPEIEIIVGDSGSNEENQQIIKNLIAKKNTGCRMKYVFVDNSEKRANNPHFNGFSSCINAAAQVAQGDILIYCDSSIIVPPKFIYEMALPLVEDDLFIRAPLLNLTPEQTKLTQEKELWKNYKELIENISPLKKSAGRPAWALRRKTFLEVGGMDESMVVYGAIDDDLVTRLMIKGIPNFHSQLPVLHMWHKESRSNHEDINAHKMMEHIKKQQYKVNNDNWGQYKWVIENR